MFSNLWNSISLLPYHNLHHSLHLSHQTAPNKIAKEPKKVVTWTHSGASETLLQALFDGKILYKGSPITGQEEPVDVFNEFDQFNHNHKLPTFRKHWNDERNERGIESMFFISEHPSHPLINLFLIS